MSVSIKSATRASEIKYIQFGVLSCEDVHAMSEAHIHKPVLYSRRITNDPHGTLYDPRMGPADNWGVCITCRLDATDCPGHFGHIELNTMLLHPLFFKQIQLCLRLFCISCSALLFTADHLRLWGIEPCTGAELESRVIPFLRRRRTCTQCTTHQPLISFNANTFQMFVRISVKHARVEIPVARIFQIFDCIKNEDLDFIGIDAKFSHPRNLILRALPVLPPRDRPYVMTDIVCDDDLTHAYYEIIRANENLKNPAGDHAKLVTVLYTRIKMLFDNSQAAGRGGGATQLKGIRERVCGKAGLIRNNLMGKRVNFSARTVIGPDPTLKLGEIAIPHEFAETLTYPERVSEFNWDAMQAIVSAGQASVIERIDGTRIQLSIALAKRPDLCRVSIGDIVHRHVRDGDFLILNRQPTLHRGGMIAMRVLRRTGKTIRMNLAVTSSFNADFDGDEMNLHAPASEMSRAELEELASLTANFVNDQSGRPVASVVQDALVGTYLMTRDDRDMGKDVFAQLLVRASTFFSLQESIARCARVMHEAGVSLPLFCGKHVISCLLPPTFFFKQQDVEIVEGVLLRGYLDKRHIKAGSLFTPLAAQYGTAIASECISDIQFVANDYLLRRGLTVSIQDCLGTAQKERQIKDSTVTCFLEAQRYETSIENPRIREAKVTLALSKAKDIGMRMARDALRKENNFLSTVLSGSKGDYFNIAQISGLLGQQNVNGGRVPPQISSGRTMPHYPCSGMQEKQVYESRGFVRHSFMSGLNPQEFWFHAMSGREGLTDTAMKTSDSGYLQRKMVKLMEDVTVAYDGTIRDGSGKIIQYTYGDNPFCVSSLRLSPQSLAAQLNAEYLAGARS